nr:MAG TPA: YopX protein [Caudoviricetes sp.]
MREIKFRVYLDKMYYQNEYNEYNTNLVGIDFFNKTVTFVAYTDGEEIDNLEKYSFDENDFLYEKDLKIMQYTGSKDKNNKEIYEGDIFYIGSKKILYIVEWIDFGLKGRQIRNKSWIGLDYWKDDIEVIGNIYENPELMEEVR